MRPRNEQPRNLLPALLRRHPGARAAELVQWTGASQRTIARALIEAGDQVIAVGRGPRRHYYWRRELRGELGQFPVFAIGLDGQAQEVAVLRLTEREGCVLDVASMGWPTEAEFADGAWPGLAYPLQDMRPQGFLGRSFARRAGPELGVSTDLREWSDDDVLHTLIQRGWDASGNLIVGLPALHRCLENKAVEPKIWSADRLQTTYAALADDASAMGAAGSSAAGEFPKFTTLRELAGAATPHVIVKFSGAEESGAVRRWADLLICEHLGLEHARRLGVRVAASRVLQVGQRTMLEVERFDRHGVYGRSPLCSLEAVESNLLNSPSHNWMVLGEEMRKRGLLHDDAARNIRLLWLYGQLIANTDMHKGNLSFAPTTSAARAGAYFELAPAYDMLPMRYAPIAGGEAPMVEHLPMLPAPSVRDDWHTACIAALNFWEAASSEMKISAGFRQICADNLKRLRQLREKA